MALLLAPSHRNRAGPAGSGIGWHLGDAHSPDDTLESWTRLADWSLVLPAVSTIMDAEVFAVVPVVAFMHRVWFMCAVETGIGQIGNIYCSRRRHPHVMRGRVDEVLPGRPE